MTIDGYVSELTRLLPRTARVRAIPEVREHLRDAAARRRAAGASPGDAELLATTEFGDVTLVATRLGSELAVGETRIAAALALVATLLFVFPFYVVPENTLPPATWDEKPFELLALQRATLLVWIAAGVLAAATVGLAWSRWRRLASVGLAASAAAMVSAGALTVVLLWRWTEHTPATPNLALASALALPILATCVGAAWLALRSRRRLALAD